MVIDVFPAHIRLATKLSRAHSFHSGVVQLSDRISQLLLPADSEYTAEEKHLLFLIQSHLLAIIHPLRSCALWDRNRVSCVSPLILQVELILTDALTFVHPLLLGQRPIAAAQYVVARQTGLAQNHLRTPHSAYNATRLITPTRARKNHPDRWSASTTSELHVRATLVDKLRECSERLHIALDLLNTAMNTIQTLEVIRTSTEPRRQSSIVCLVTLLAAHRRLLTLDKCSGDLMLVRGRLLVDAGLCSQFRIDPTVRHECRGSPTRGKTSEAPISGWHVLPLTCELRMRRLSASTAPVLMLHVQGEKKCRQKACSALKALRGFVNELLRGRTCSFKVTASTHLRADEEILTILESRLAESACDCLSGGPTNRWEPLESGSESGSAYEHVCVDEGDGAAHTCATADSSHSNGDVPVGATSAEEMLKTRKMCLGFGVGLLEDGESFSNKVDNSFMALVVECKSSSVLGHSATLEFVYLARLLMSKFNTSAAKLTCDWLEDCNHEELVNLLR